jgi:hypothetical protein
LQGWPHPFKNISGLSETKGGKKKQNNKAGG